MPSFRGKGLEMFNFFDGSSTIQAQRLLGETLVLTIICPVPSHTGQRLPLYGVELKSTPYFTVSFVGFPQVLLSSGCF